MKIYDDNKSVIIELSDACVQSCIDAIPEGKEDYRILVERKDGSTMPLMAFDEMRGYEVKSGYPYNELKAKDKECVWGMCLAIDSVRGQKANYQFDLSMEGVTTHDKILLEIKIEAVEEVEKAIWLDVDDFIISALDNEADE